jgi:DNA-binding LacI/PurR family transcriptional regulator
MTHPTFFKQEYQEDDNVVTIADVAQLAGVSVSTVSRILNGKPDVSPATRERVQRVIAELGYIPQVSAQSLAARRSRTIALLFPMDHVRLTQLELDFLVGAATAAEAQGYFLNLMTSPTPPNRLLSLYRSRQVDGVVLMQVRMRDKRVQALVEKNHPFVMIGRTAYSDGLSYVDLDFEAALTLAFEHLHTAGHRQIGFIARPALMRERDIGSAVRSLQGYLNACATHNCQPIYCEPDMEAEHVHAATLRLLLDNPDITALIVANGTASVPALRAASALGRRVPHDLAMSAITTNRLAELVTPPLTAINFPTDHMGHQATEILLNLLKDANQPPQQVLLAPELVIRETTGTRHR